MKLAWCVAMASLALGACSSQSDGPSSGVTYNASDMQACLILATLGTSKERWEQQQAEFSQVNRELGGDTLHILELSYNQGDELLVSAYACQDG